MNSLLERLDSDEEMEITAETGRVVGKTVFETLASSDYSDLIPEGYDYLTDQYKASPTNYPGGSQHPRDD